MTFSQARLNSSMFREGMVTNRISAKLGGRRVRAGPVAEGRPLPSLPAPVPVPLPDFTSPAAQEPPQPPSVTLWLRPTQQSLTGPLPLPGTGVSSVGQDGGRVPSSSTS